MKYFECCAIMHLNLTLTKKNKFFTEMFINSGLLYF